MYKKITNNQDQTISIERKNQDGSISSIPCDLSNFDYQAYLNSIEHLTEIIPADEA